MRKFVLGIVVLALLATGGYTVFASNQSSTSCKSPVSAATASSCASSCSSPSAAAASVAPRGNLTGHFDPAMSGMCRFSCATKLKYNARNVLAQPGAQPGKLTRCPVSGVVFAVDANRPHVRIAGNEYVTCCDHCVAKLKKDPRHYLKV